MDSNKNAGLYIHIPFCSNKCDYCSFYSLVKFDKTLIKNYLDKVLLQIEFLKKKYKIHEFDTIFVGGGTPSLLPADLFSKFLEKLDLQNVKEFTVEVNPESVNKDFLEVCRDNKVNRISVGVQTFSNEHRKKIGRKSQEKQVLDGLNLIKDFAFPKFSVDLISHLPGDNIERITNDIKIASSFGINHLSIYALSIEEGTALEKQNPEIPDLDEDYDRAIKKACEDEGLLAYEVSNYAKPGYESLHNLKYWKMHDFIGVGVTASGTMNLGKGFFQRHENIANVEEYLSCTNTFEKTNYSQLSKNEAIFEHLMMGLRLLQGINNKEFSVKFEKNPRDYIPQTYSKYKNYFDNTENFTKLNSQGMDILNIILLDVMEELEF